VSEESSRVVLERLRAITWEDSDRAFDHTRSRALLMREYLRRAALWAQAVGAEDAWPFFDIAERVDPSVQLPPDIAAELEEFLASNFGRDPLRKTCHGAVRWAALRDQTKVNLPELLDPYEPLLLMYERGGGFYREVLVELNGIAIRLGNVESNLTAPPFLALAPATLDALDAEGRITYYALINENFPRENPLGIFRRRLHRDETYDEAFTRNLRWEPTEYLKLYWLGHNDIGHVEISEAEAGAGLSSRR
jgi:hypothetical protein